MSEQKDLKFCVDCIYCSKENSEFTCDNPSFIKTSVSPVDGKKIKEIKYCNKLREEGEACGVIGNGFIAIKKGLATLIRNEEMFRRLSSFIPCYNIESVYYYQTLSMQDRHRHLRAYTKARRQQIGYKNSLDSIGKICERKLEEVKYNNKYCGISKVVAKLFNRNNKNGI